MVNYIQNNIQGRVLWCDGYSTYKSIRNNLYISHNGGQSWELVFKVKGENFIERVIYSNSLACRLFRKGFHHLAKKEDVIALIFNKRMLLLRNHKLVGNKPIVGSRPLSFETLNDEFVFGEYRSNPERSNIGLYSVNVDAGISKKLELSGIRHIHGVYKDTYQDKVWITTGDLDNEAALYCSDMCFRSLDKVLYGSQQTRMIKVLFDPDYIYYGSDAPNETNYIYRMNRNTKAVEKLVKVGSSVFHGCKIKNWFFFSTAIEPSTINTTQYAEIWASPDGTDWKCIMKYKKDIWSAKYFQYGQIFFASGLQKNSLWITLFALKGGEKSFKISINEIEYLFNSGLHKVC